MSYDFLTTVLAATRRIQRSEVLEIFELANSNGQPQPLGGGYTVISDGEEPGLFVLQVVANGKVIADFWENAEGNFKADICGAMFFSSPAYRSPETSMTCRDEYDGSVYRATHDDEDELKNDLSLELGAELTIIANLAVIHAPDDRDWDGEVIVSPGDRGDEGEQPATSGDNGG